MASLLANIFSAASYGATIESSIVGMSLLWSMTCLDALLLTGHRPGFLEPDDELRESGPHEGLPH
jgi:hypothetical protein